MQHLPKSLAARSCNGCHSISDSLNLISVGKGVRQKHGQNNSYKGNVNMIFTDSAQRVAAGFPRIRNSLRCNPCVKLKKLNVCEFPSRSSAFTTKIASDFCEEKDLLSVAMNTREQKLFSKICSLCRRMSCAFGLRMKSSLRGAICVHSQNWG